jgi:hypothetical protein
VNVNENDSILGDRSARRAADLTGRQSRVKMCKIKIKLCIAFNVLQNKVELEESMGCKRPIRAAAGV